MTGGEGSKGKVERGGEETGEKGREGDGKEGKGREGEVGCGARRPAGARSPALAKDGPGFEREIAHCDKKYFFKLRFLQLTMLHIVC